MARQSKPAANNPKIPNTPSAPTVTTIKKHNTKSLEGKARLGYEIGHDADGCLQCRIASNSGGGFFSDEWVPVPAILEALTRWAEDKPITSMALKSLFTGKSVNTPSFLLAVLLEENVIARVDGKRRHYQLGDIPGFQKRMAALKRGHSTAAKCPPEAKAKAGRRMAKTQTSAA